MYKRQVRIPGARLLAGSFARLTRSLAGSFARWLAGSFARLLVCLLTRLLGGCLACPVLTVVPSCVVLESRCIHRGRMENIGWCLHGHWLVPPATICEGKPGGGGVVILRKKKRKTSAVSTTDGWLKLNFPSCVIRYVRHAHCALLFSTPFVVWCL